VSGGVSNFLQEIERRIGASKRFHTEIDGQFIDCPRQDL
jgi:hypothetical protein